MTRKEMARYLDLKERLERNEETLKSLRSTAEPGAQNVTGMPHGNGVKDRIGDLAAEIGDFEAATAALRIKVEKAEKRVFSFIEGVDDEQMRLILRLRFVRLLTWQEVADIIGGNNTTDGVKSTYYRFMKTMNKNLQRRDPHDA